MSAPDEIQGTALAPLLELARSRLTGEPPLRAARFEALAARAQAHERDRRARSRAAYGVALAAIVVLVAFFSWPRAELTYRVEAGNVDASGQVLGGPNGASIHFSDGSLVALEPFARTRVEDVTALGGRVRLEHGSARVAITKRPRASWSIEAGPYVVQVTGTAFDVSWSEADQSLKVGMESGSVVVKGPLVADGLPLQKGQRLSLVLSKRSVTVEDGRSAVRDVPFAPPAPLFTASAEVPAPVAPSRPPAKAEASRHPWVELVAQGNFGAVIEAAENRGLDKILAQGSADELSALADAARYGQRPDIARVTLLSQRRRFGGTQLAEQAAFFLGRLSEGSGEAIEWYDRYLAESPRGSYVPQALGRKLMVVHQQQGAGSARPLAEDYLRRYPNGPYAAAAKKILGDSRPTADPVRTPPAR